MSKALDQLDDEYGLKKNKSINPIHKKWFQAAWAIQTVYDLVYSEEISLSKARELTTAIIEKYAVINNNNNKIN